MEFNKNNNSFDYSINKLINNYEKLNRINYYPNLSKENLINLKDCKNTIQYLFNKGEEAKKETTLIDYKIKCLDEILKQYDYNTATVIKPKIWIYFKCSKDENLNYEDLDEKLQQLEDKEPRDFLIDTHKEIKEVELKENGLNYLSTKEREIFTDNYNEVKINNFKTNKKYKKRRIKNGIN